MEGSVPVRPGSRIPRGFQKRQVHGHRVHVGVHRGYNVVLWRRSEMAYALVSGVDVEELIDLAVSTER